MTHFAIQLRSGGFLVGFDRNDWRYLTTDARGPMQLWQTRGAAEEGARVIGGRVVPVSVQAQEDQAGEWLEAEVGSAARMPVIVVGGKRDG